MVGVYRRVKGVRCVAHAAGAAVLFLYALLTAFAPADLLLLANDDDLFSGVITRAEWQRHQQEHLQLARDALSEAGLAPLAPAPARSSDATRPADALPGLPGTRHAGITSVPTGYGVHSELASAAAALLFCLVLIGVLKDAGTPSLQLAVRNLSPHYGVRRLPPRLLA